MNSQAHNRAATRPDHDKPDDDAGLLSAPDPTPLDGPDITVERPIILPRDVVVRKKPLVVICASPHVHLENRTSVRDKSKPDVDHSKWTRGHGRRLSNRSR